jgi:hypothetical protein
MMLPVNITAVVGGSPLPTVTVTVGELAVITLDGIEMFADPRRADVSVFSIVNVTWLAAAPAQKSGTVVGVNAYVLLGPPLAIGIATAATSATTAAISSQLRRLLLRYACSMCFVMLSSSWKACGGENA